MEPPSPVSPLLLLFSLLLLLGTVNAACPNPRQEQRLQDAVRVFEFQNDESANVTITWVGRDTGVVLAVSRVIEAVSWKSRLYRSEDYGGSFSDISALVDGGHALPALEVIVGPGSSQRVVLLPRENIARDVKVWISEDGGKTFRARDMPFTPQHGMAFHSASHDHLLASSSSNELWITEDFFGSFKKLGDAVRAYKWSPQDTTAYYLASPHGQKVEEAIVGTLELMRSSDSSRSAQRIAERVYSFGIGGRFLCASVVHEKDKQRVLQVSTDQGDSWTMAQLPPIDTEEFYSILGADDNIIFVHVDEKGDTGRGTLYVSDDRGAVFSESLASHLYTARNGSADFINVTSARGAFITSRLSADGSARSVITFDQGGAWQPLPRPTNVPCEGGNGEEQCRLTIHSDLSMSQEVREVPHGPLSEPSASGLVLAHGTVGQSQAPAAAPDVYVSRDGGHSWARSLEGPHVCAILNSGGLLVAVPYAATVNTVRFSLDEGRCWGSVMFSLEPLALERLLTEPGARSLSASVLARRLHPTPRLVLTTIDFSQLLQRNCVAGDYEEWTAPLGRGCVLGSTEHDMRLKPDAACRTNGQALRPASRSVPCPCTQRDYSCDFGFFRPNGSWECVEEASAPGRRSLHVCARGQQEELLTQGYRKIPGDRCEGGFRPSGDLRSISKTCTYSLQDDPKLHLHWGVIATVVVVLALAVLAATLIVRKYCCRMSMPVYRFSQLEQNDEFGCDEVDADKLLMLPDSDDVSGVTRHTALLLAVPPMGGHLTSAAFLSATPITRGGDAVLQRFLLV
ncbi:sortilin-like isoform X2 [Petromyzon marinus]|uniref:sortilin-like isoform X2 n=1 Tax=Petromyzon marinus TaxID=7757 RepID=UPI003F727D85